jgi:hypothetical protein
MNKKIRVPNAKVLAKLAELAGVKEPPLRRSMHHSAFAENNHQRFEREVQVQIKIAHDLAALTNAAQFKTDKKICRLALELVKTLKKFGCTPSFAFSSPRLDSRNLHQRA